MRLNTIYIILLSLLLGASPGFAQNNDLDIIDKTLEVYGISALERAKTVRIDDDIRILFGSHDYSPHFNQWSEGKRQHILDFKNKRASSEYLSIITGNTYHSREILTPDALKLIDYGNDKYRDGDVLPFDQFYGGMIRSNDLLLARALKLYRPSAKSAGDMKWLGVPHARIEMDYPNSPPLTLYIEKGTGYISKMERTAPNGTVLSYVFTNHKRAKKLAIAREHRFYIGEDLMHYTVDRNVVLNDRKDRNVFEIDNYVVQEPERVDQSEMTVEEVSDGVYHVGQNGIYSTFIIQDAGLIGLGAEGGFGDRLTALREKTSNQSPLTSLMVADHHEEEFAGASDAVSAGAKLMITSQSKAKLDALFADNEIKPRYEVIEDKHQIGGVTLFNIETSHAERVLVAHHGASGSLYQSSHYISPYPNERFQALLAAVDLYGELVKLNLNIDRVLSSGSRKPETWSNFAADVADYNPEKCANNRLTIKPCGPAPAGQLVIVLSAWSAGRGA